MSGEFTDEELLARFRNSFTKNQAFEAILDKYQKRTYWHIRRIVIDHDDADDLVQNTFIKVWENLDNFKENSKLYTWIYRIATNESLQFLQKKRTVSLHDVDQEMLEKIESGAYFNGNDAEIKLQHAILTLPEKQRIVFNLRYYDNMKYEDMAEFTDTSVGALKASYHHAVKKIEEFISRPLNLTDSNPS